MLDVVNNSTPYLSDDDINAMAAYLKSLPAATQQAAYTYDNATTTALDAGKVDAGGKLYAGYCLTCHGADGKGQVPFLPPLAGNPVVLDNNPSSLINLVLNGAQTIVVKGTPDSYRMPQYRVQLTDDEIASVLTFVRSAWGNGAPAVSADEVKKLRPITDPSSDHVIILKMR
jgi:mono/diheme cytochrome c family protein